MLKIVILNKYTQSNINQTSQIEPTSGTSLSLSDNVQDLNFGREY